MIKLRRGWTGSLLDVESCGTGASRCEHTDEERKVELGIYEGGGALWECAKDLIDVLDEDFASDKDLGRLLASRKPLRVLELGCGKALPALKLAKLRAAAGLKTELILQDLNEEVIWEHTIPALKELGTEVDAICTVCTWEDMVRALQPGDRYDLILSSETVYRTETFETITQIVEYCLISQAYFSQKRYYFGLGGGSLAYVLYLKTSGSRLNTRFAKSIEDGQSNVRDVFVITP